MVKITYEYKLIIIIPGFLKAMNILNSKSEQKMFELQKALDIFDSYNILCTVLLPSTLQVRYKQFCFDINLFKL